MSFFYNLDKNKSVEKRIASRLLQLKDAMQAHGVPPKSLDDYMLLATWNLRDFGDRAYGYRTKEPLHYIAEIISAYDLVALQEVNKDLGVFMDLMETLGPWWDYIITDVTVGKRGNDERMAFVFDTRKVKFEKLAAEVVIPPIELRDENGERTVEPAKQLYRTPYLACFSNSWFKFMICTVHIQYGKNLVNSPTRIEEIRAVSNFLANLAKDEHAFANNIILLGDFNIFRPSHDTFKAVTDAGFYVPEELQALPTNAAGDKHYDQIAFYCPTLDAQEAYMNAGVFDFFEHVYTMNDVETYKPEMGNRYYYNSKGEARDQESKARYFKVYWRTQQMSDHLPMWMQIKTDFGRAYLKGIE